MNEEPIEPDVLPGSLEATRTPVPVPASTPRVEYYEDEDEAAFSLWQTPAITALLAANLLIYALTHYYLKEVGPYALYHPKSPFFQPHQLITHLFMHGGLIHLAFNMLSLYMIGPHVERSIGTKRFLILYFLSGAGAILGHVGAWEYSLAHSTNIFEQMTILQQSMLGASGAVYGIVIGFSMIYPNARLMLIFPPIPIKAKYLAPAIISIDLFLGLRGMRTGVAHFAHIGGGLFGCLIMLYWLVRHKIRSTRLEEAAALAQKDAPPPPPPMTPVP
jgi:membrane associated rhomboid family serine protease